MERGRSERTTPLDRGIAEEILALIGRRRTSIRALALDAQIALSTLNRRLGSEPEGSFRIDQLDRIATALGVVIVELIPVRLPAVAAAS